MLDSTLSSYNSIHDKSLIRNFGYIGGKWIGAETGTTISVTNPATSDKIGEIASLSADESATSVDAAQAAFLEWSSLLPQVRSTILRRWYGLILKHKEDLAQIMVLEQGKPLSEARGEIEYGASFVEFYAEEAKRPNLEGVTSHLKGPKSSFGVNPLVLRP